MLIRGSQLVLSVDGDYINCETSCELAVNTEMLGKSSSTGGKWRHFREGYKDWTMTADARTILSSFNGSFNRVIDKMIFGGQVRCEMSFTIDNSKVISISGQAYPQNFNLLSPSQGYSTYNVVFQGTGELFTEFEEFFTIINAMPYNSDKLLTFIA